MIAAKIFPLVCLSIILSASAAQAQPDDKKAGQPPVFTEINKSLLGDRWYSFMLFGKKNVGTIHEVIEEVDMGGASVYKVTSNSDLDVGFTSQKGSETLLLRPDFTIISLDSKYENAVPSMELTGKVSMKCDSVSRSKAKCIKTAGDKDPESLELETPSGENIYMVMPLMRAVKWAPGVAFSAYEIEYSDAHLKDKNVKWLGREKVTISGKDVDAVSLVESSTGPDHEQEVYNVLVGEDSIMYRIKTNVEDMKIEIVLGTRQEAYADNYVSSYDRPFGELTPEQVVSRFELASMKNDVNKEMECLDLRAMYEKSIDQGHKTGGFDDFVNSTKAELIKKIKEMNEDAEITKINNMFVMSNNGIDLFDLLFLSTAKTDIKGDTAKVNALTNQTLTTPGWTPMPGQNDGYFLNRTKDGWKIVYNLYNLSVPRLK